MHPGHRHRRRTARRWWTAALAALALPLTMLGTSAAPAQAAALQCSVDYRTNDWGSGFTAELTLTNRGPDAIDGWTLTYSYTGDQKLTNGWSGTWSQSGRNVTVRNASYNARIAAGAAVSTGGQFTYSGSNAAPTDFAVNGTSCAGAHQPPITVLTSPEAGAVYSQGEAFRWRPRRRRPTAPRSARWSSTTTPPCSAPTRARPTRTRPRAWPWAVIPWWRRPTTARAPPRAPRRSASPSPRDRPWSPPPVNWASSRASRRPTTSSSHSSRRRT